MKRVHPTTICIGHSGVTCELLEYFTYFRFSSWRGRGFDRPATPNTPALPTIGSAPWTKTTIERNRMNRFYDYMIVRIYRWYESFENEPSLFTAKLLIAFHQSFIFMTIVHFIWEYVHFSTIIYKSIGVSLGVLLFIRLHFRYSNKEFFQSLLQNWRHEERTKKIIKGVVIPFIIFLPSIIYLIL